jgi:hypothetical protein
MVLQASANYFAPPAIKTSFNLAKDQAPTPEQLANAMAKMERERYQRILPIEYIAYAGRLTSYHPNLSSAIALNKLIHYWVRSSILDMDSITDQNGLANRSNTKQFFIETGRVIFNPSKTGMNSHLNDFCTQACRNINNFSSLGAIMEALQSDSIACLSTTHANMPTSIRNIFNDLAKFSSSNNSYSEYKQCLSKCESKGCVPWHGTHVCVIGHWFLTAFLYLVVDLYDINHTINNQVDVDDQHDPPLINFEKWAHLKCQATSALRHLDVPFKCRQEGIGNAVEYLKMGLRSVSVNGDLEDILTKRSKKLKHYDVPRRAGLVGNVYGT